MIVLLLFPGPNGRFIFGVVCIIGKTFDSEEIFDVAVDDLGFVIASVVLCCEGVTDASDDIIDGVSDDVNTEVGSGEGSVSFFEITCVIDVLG